MFLNTKAVKRLSCNTLALHVSKGTVYGGTCVICGAVSYLSLLYPEAADTRTTFLKHLILCPHLRGKDGKSYLSDLLSVLKH